MKKTNLITYLIFAFFCVSFLAFLVFNPSHAYFQLFMKDSSGVNSTKVDLLFDKFDSDGKYGEFDVTLDSTWGTPQNPYVINAPNHVSNLSVLQRSGYFAKKDYQCYFVVCTPTGYPVAVDCDGMEIIPVGSQETPFTGVIKGAPLVIPEGTDVYTGTEYTNVYKTPDNKDLTTTQSAITNLIVAATDATPDIGFFGRLGYNGTLEDKEAEVDTGLKDENGDAITETITTTVLNGYAAQIENLLFADVTISAAQNPPSDWWAEFAGKDEDHDACEETHHLGIIAGHAEWASLKKISVYYSENVAAFNLPEDMNSNTNFYSVVGLIGTATNVNPTYTYNTSGALVSISIQNSVSDKQLTEELVVGGGGSGTGSFTGYMLARNIFNMHEDYLTKNSGTLKSEYEVTEMKKANGSDFFSSQVITEYPNISSSLGGWFGWDAGIKRRYYYFKDTIFTFAMSSYDTESDDGTFVPTGSVDKIIELWETADAANYFYVTPATDIAGTITKDENGEQIETSDGIPDDWQLSGVTNPAENYLYKLEAVDLSSIAAGGKVTLESGVDYVLAYRYMEYATDEEGNPTSEIIADKLYAFDMMNASYVREISPYEDNDTYKTVEIDGVLDSLYVQNANSAHINYAFNYGTKSNNFNVSIALATNNSEKFGAKIQSTGFLDFYDPILYRGTAGAANGSGGFFIGGSDAYWYDWSFYRPTGDSLSKNAIIVNSGKNTDDNTTGYGSSGGNRLSAVMYFDLALHEFSAVFEGNVSANDDGTYTLPDIPQTATSGLLLFKVAKTDKTLQQKEFVADTTKNTTLRFQASKDVLFYDSANSTASSKKYIVTPLAQKKWNDGKGQYLLSINHAVKLAQGLANNYQMNFGSLSDILSFLNTNSGGVVPVEIGTTGTTYTVPAGMIAFYISDADPKSEINIIVAVNPEQGASSIGLWGPRTNENFTNDFHLNSPDFSFPLPSSSVPYSNSDAKEFVNISGYYTLQDNQYVLQTGDYTTHLNGNVVLVGYTFEVTQPGIYLLGSTSGPMTVSYFSVTGAASGGDDGTGGSPLGDVDFVYDNGSNTIITVDKKFTGTHVVEDETPETLYYPSYYYIRMIPDADYSSAEVTDPPSNGKIPYDIVFVRRYLAEPDPERSNNKRNIKINRSDGDTKLDGFSQIYQDIGPDESS